jgi:signal transduction histidine kinase
VEDSAGGIKDSIIGKIFDPYITTKEQFGGTGLGLYIAKIIIEERMNGKLDVSNSPIGAKFIISLPRNGVEVE